TGDSFIFTPCSRNSWDGCINVRLIYRFFNTPISYGKPHCSAYPIAAEILESGTAVTTSALGTGCSFASSIPIRLRAECTFTKFKSLSGREKYTYSIAHNFLGSRKEKRVDFTPSSLIVSISPGKISLSKVGPTILNAHVSDATTSASPNRPSDNGRIPCGSSATNILSSVKIMNAYAPTNSPSAAIIASSVVVSPLFFFIKCANTSVSDVV